MFSWVSVQDFYGISSLSPKTLPKDIFDDI